MPNRLEPHAERCTTIIGVSSSHARYKRHRVCVTRRHKCTATVLQQGLPLPGRCKLQCKLAHLRIWQYFAVFTMPDTTRTTAADHPALQLEKLRHCTCSMRGVERCRQLICMLRAASYTRLDLHIYAHPDFRSSCEIYRCVDDITTSACQHIDA